MRGRRKQVGVETQAADECGATADGMGQFMDGEAAVAHEDIERPGNHRHS